MGVHCCCLHVNYIGYKYFDRSLHVRSVHPTCVQKFRPVPLTVFDIQGFKLKNKNDKKKKNWRNGLFAISPMFVVQFSTTFTCTCILTSAIILWCRGVKSGLSLKVKVQIGIFKCTGIMGQDLIHPYIQSTTVLCYNGSTTYIVYLFCTAGFYQWVYWHGQFYLIFKSRYT